MDEFVADTHALLWYFSDSRKLGSKASKIFDEADNGNAILHIPAIVVAELYYANVKTGKPIDFSDAYRKLDQSDQFVFTPFAVEDVLDFDNDSTVTEMHDRIIVGVSRRLNAPLLTVDRNITASGLVKIIW